jgi:hypothetical protein
LTPVPVQQRVTAHTTTRNVEGFRCASDIPERRDDAK